MFTILQIKKSTRKKPAGKTNQQGLETSYQMIKGPDLHHAQHSLTHLIQSSTKVNIIRYIRKNAREDLPNDQIRHHKSKHVLPPYSQHKEDTSNAT
jgi:hypothetical protein